MTYIRSVARFADPGDPCVSWLSPRLLLDDDEEILVTTWDGLLDVVKRVNCCLERKQSSLDSGLFFSVTLEAGGRCKALSRLKCLPAKR